MRELPTILCGACGGQFTDRIEHAEICLGPFPEDWWTENDGDVLWWTWDKTEWMAEAPYVGSPLDCGIAVEMRSADQPDKILRHHVGGWPDYHTHWTRLPPNPPMPESY